MNYKTAYVLVHIHGGIHMHWNVYIKEYLERNYEVACIHRNTQEYKYIQHLYMRDGGTH
jgi:hypothetical protein